MAVGNPVGANLALIALAISGLLVYRSMPREVFPDFSLDAIEVFTLSPGSSPVDVERLVTTPIEDVLDGLDGVKEMRSVSREGVSRIRLTLEPGADLDEVLASARDSVRGGDVQLPDGTDDPTVSEAKNRFPVIAVFVYGTADDMTLKAIAEEQSRAMEALPGVTSVIATGLLEPRIWIEVDPLEMERHGLDLEEIGAAVSGRVAEVPLGSLEVDRREKLLRVGGDVRWAEDLAQLPIRSSPTGAEITLERVARVAEASRRGASRGRFNGQPCVHLQVNKSSDGDTIDIAREVREYVAAHADEMPPGVALGLNSDLSVYVENRLQTMTNSGLVGAVLVILALLGFLSPQVAFVTALGIPLSFLGGILVAGSLGVTMNMIAMFALIVVLGMIVDDAIVVGENVYRRMEEGEDPETAAVEGTVEVGRAVFATILTSVAAFLPILMLGGTTGLFMRPLPIVVSACLLISLIEAFTLLPSHLAHWTSKRSVAKLQARSRAAGGEVQRWYTPIQSGYLWLLTRAIRWRYATLAGALGAGAMIGAYGGVRIPFVLFDDFESKLFYVSLRLDPSSSIEQTESVCREVEADVERIASGEVVSAHTLLGVAASDVASFELGAHLGQVWVELREGEGRKRTTAEVIEALRQELGDLPPIVESYEISQPQTGPSGRDIEVSLRGPKLDVLKEKADALALDLATFAGARDVRIDLEAGKGQVDVVPNQRGRQVGLSEAELARQLRTAFEGVEVASVRRGTDDVDVIVKHPESHRSRAGVLGDLRIALPPRPGDDATGALRRVPLRDVADLVETVGPASIRHEDRIRSVIVSADVDEKQGNSTRILRTLERDLEDLFGGQPAYSVRIRGQAEEQAESMAGLGAAALISGLLIYLVLGTLFQSFLQPLVIMFIIPFAGVGMVFGHALMDRSITLMSLIGLLALAGVVVNDSLILVDFIGQRRRQGVELMQAVMDSGRLRFRPILLTSVTTMLGLLPLTFFATGQARFLQPMAISIFFGLSLATLLILVLVPVAYLVLEDLVALARRTLRGIAVRARPR
ncbi:Multidrug resistance protein MdtC [Planctomycetes bacterium Poly30]|uniref:Multidrug resistance protein MdtC n=1 Tax=Saltatorellus ferox TaxID=2528018 RepID=A0A518ES83_9BACT|nr:Multidrug resistance protein MdtC [Planctomycetes bacterium Poly30]